MQVCYTDEDESKGVFVDESSTDEIESECVHKNVNKEKDAKNDTEYEEPSATHEVLSYFKIFECGKNLLNVLDMTYERACMATPRDKYYEKM